MRRAFPIVAAVILSCARESERAEGPEAGAVPTQDIKEHDLSNGLKLLFIQRDMSPIAPFSVW